MTTRLDLPRLAAFTLLLAAAACRSQEQKTVAETGAAARGADTSRGAMAGGMQAMHQDTLAAKVEAHLRRLDTTNPDSLRALVPVDREVVTTLIADCEQMMRAMKMEPPRKWRNAVQDLRQDLDRMASMSGAQLRTVMPEHRTRIEGMLAMRRDMMRM